MRRTDTGPFVLIPRWVLDHPDLDDGTKILYAVLAKHADSGTGDCWPSRRTLAAECGNVSTKTIDRRLAALVAVEALAVKPRWDAERQTSNCYTVLRVKPGGATPVSRGGDTSVQGEGDTGVAPELEPEGTRKTAPPALRLAPSVQPFDLTVEDATTTSFDEFWNVYPRKTEKRRARTVYAAALARAHADEILAGARRLADHVTDRDVELRYVKHPATWLNVDGWLDVLPPVRRDPGEAETLRLMAETTERLARGEVPR